MPNVGPYIYDVSISGFTRSSIYIYIYMYDISSLRVKSAFLIAGVEVLTAVLLKIRIFWDVMPCRLVNRYRSFEGAAFLAIRR